MTDTPHDPTQRHEPRFDPAGEYAALMRDRARESEAALASERAARAAAERASQDRLIRAELAAIALTAGIIDPDLVRLVDPASAGVKLDDAGAVVGGQAAIDAFRAAKPWAFRKTAAEEGRSSSTASPPAASPAAGKSAKEMTHAEWRAARARLISQ